MARSIHLSGELSTEPDETFAQAAERIVTRKRGENLCEMVGYYGFVNTTSIVVETREDRCTLLYDAAGKLQHCAVGKHIVWQRGAA